MLYLFDDCSILLQERERAGEHHTQKQDPFSGLGGWQFAEGGGMAHCVSGLSAREAFRAMAKNPPLLFGGRRRGEGRELCNFPPLPFSGKHTHTHTLITPATLGSAFNGFPPTSTPPHPWATHTPGSGLFVSGTYPRWILLICAAHPSWIDKWYIIFPAQSPVPSTPEPPHFVSSRGGKPGKSEKRFSFIQCCLLERFASDERRVLATNLEDAFATQ